MARLLAAMKFLTILPIAGEADTDDLAGAVPFFVVVGLILGTLAAGIAWVLGLFPPLVAAALLVAVLLAFSGGLHMDGLSDTADGFLSARPRERTLEIMKDSHVGAMGVMAVVLVLVVKFAALASLRNVSLVMAAWLIPVCGRGAIVLVMAMLPYVRPGGVASVFGSPSPLTVGIAAAAMPVMGLLVAGVNGVVAAGAAIVAAAGMAAWSHRRIGGATGDTYGAACELAEVATAVALTLPGIHPFGH